MLKATLYLITLFAVAYGVAIETDSVTTGVLAVVIVRLWFGK